MPERLRGEGVGVTGRSGLGTEAGQWSLRGRDQHRGKLRLGVAWEYGNFEKTIGLRASSVYRSFVLLCPILGHARLRYVFSPVERLGRDELAPVCGVLVRHAARLAGWGGWAGASG